MTLHENNKQDEQDEGTEEFAQKKKEILGL
jgi:hypothetical protein